MEGHLDDVPFPFFLDHYFRFSLNDNGLLEPKRSKGIVTEEVKGTERDRKRSYLKRQNGQTHQESLGEADCYDGGSLYVTPLTLSRFRAPAVTDANHSLDQMAAALEGFFWPKIFWDFLTKTLDPAVKPFPILQIINLVQGMILLAMEWPAPFLAGSSLHRSLEFRLALLPLCALAAILLYQGTNAGLYYLIGMGIYFWAYSEGEVSYTPIE